jgi:hypothetical protein
VIGKNCNKTDGSLDRTADREPAAKNSHAIRPRSMSRWKIFETVAARLRETDANSTGTSENMTGATAIGTAITAAGGILSAGGTGARFWSSWTRECQGQVLFVNSTCQHMHIPNFAFSRGKNTYLVKVR